MQVLRLNLIIPQTYKKINSLLYILYKNVHSLIQQSIFIFYQIQQGITLKLDTNHLAILNLLVT